MRIELLISIIHMNYVYLQLNIIGCLVTIL